MTPKSKGTEIEAMRRWLSDEPSDNDQTTQMSGSLEIPDVQPDLEAAIPQTRATTRAGQTQAPISCSPQFEEGNNNRSKLPQMTPFGEESSF